MTPAQSTAVERVEELLQELGAAFAECSREGLRPCDALREAGMDVPGYAAPMLNQAIEQALGIGA